MLSTYYQKNKDKLQKYARERKRKLYKENPEYFKKQNKNRSIEQVKRWRRNNWIRNRYNIEPDIYDKLLEDQNNICAICKCKLIGNHALDHCHKTNKIRKFLCKMCNSGLGFFGDNIEVLEEAIKYLREFK